jgi:hypothetical protein
MRFVDDQQRNLCGDTRQNLGVKAARLPAARARSTECQFPRFDASLPSTAVQSSMVVGIDRGGANAHPLCRCDLISHQRQ